jgi:hypothetical protein
MDSVNNIFSRLCVICGKRPATTVDHIPPKGIFPKPRPRNLITVPACFSCNQESSKYDESFMVYLSLHVGTDSPESKRLWEKHAIRTVKHNRRLRTRLVTTMRRVDVKSPGGIIIGQGVGSSWDSEAHDRVVERMIRGLYFYHYRDILGDRAHCKVQWLQRIDKKVYELFEPLPQYAVGNDLFLYRYGRAQEEPVRSIWLFQFYERHWASGYTQPADQLIELAT